MLGETEAIEVALPVPIPLRCGLEVRSPDLDAPTQQGGAMMMAIGDETWEVRAFDRRRGSAIMHELTPLLTVGAERGNSFALYDHTFWMWWRSFFHEDRDLCRKLVERASAVPRPAWEDTLAASLGHAASALSLQLDERLLTAWGEVRQLAGYRGARPRQVAARLELTASLRRFVVEADLARSLPEATYAPAPKVRNPALLTLGGRRLNGAPDRQRFIQVKGPMLPEASSFALESALQELPAEVAECETGPSLRVSVHDLEAIRSVHGLVWSTVRLAARIDDDR